MSGETAERVWWRAWLACVWVASGAVAVQGWLRLDLLGGAGRPAACRVVAGTDELLPADCWLPVGWLGIRGWQPSWGDAGWVVLAVVAVAAAAGSVLAGSAARRQALLLRIGSVWVLGGLAAGWAFERNVATSTGAGPGWPLRVLAWAPWALTVGLLHGFWSASPWRTLEGPGLRARRRAAARRRVERVGRRAELWVRARSGTATAAAGLVRIVGLPARLSHAAVDRWDDWIRGSGDLPPLPEVHRPPTPVRLTWPVPAGGAVAG